MDDEEDPYIGTETSYKLLKVSPPYAYFTDTPLFLEDDVFHDKIGDIYDNSDDPENFLAPEPITRSSVEINKPEAMYPTLSSIPKTGFTCQGKIGDRLYTDFEARCQVMHLPSIHIFKMRLKNKT